MRRLVREWFRPDQDESSVTTIEPQMVSRMLPIAYGTV